MSAYCSAIDSTDKQTYGATNPATVLRSNFTADNAAYETTNLAAINGSHQSTDWPANFSANFPADIPTKLPANFIPH